MAEFVALHLNFPDEYLKKVEVGFKDAPNETKHEVRITVGGEDFTTTFEQLKVALLSLKNG